MKTITTVPPITASRVGIDSGGQGGERAEQSGHGQVGEIESEGGSRAPADGPSDPASDAAKDS